MQPLSGLTIWVTRARTQATELAELLRAEGATVVELPTIEIVPPEDTSPIDAAVKTLEHFDWILFTSVNAVHFFLRHVQSEIDVLRRKKIGAVGAATAAALEHEGLEVALRPNVFDGQALADALVATGPVRGRKFLLPRAEHANEALPQSLRDLGAEVKTIVVYRTVAPASLTDKLRETLQVAPPDVLTFTSASTVDNFVKSIPPEWSREALDAVAVAAVGPTTAQAAAELGLRPSIVPQRSSMRDLVDAILVFARER